MMFRPLPLLGFFACATLALSVACSSGEDGANAPDGGGSGSGAAAGAGVGGSGSSIIEDGLGGLSSGGGYGGNVTANPKGEVYCGDVLCQCNDGLDNDDDGVTDGFDIECTGPFDNDESSFATGIPGDNSDEKWQDCFFDGNSGAGDDGCRYHGDCLTGAKPLTDPACQVTDGCVDFCAQFASNGCDCFGCCEVHDGDDVSFIRAGECDFEAGDCQSCQQSDQCVNTCTECELCAGKTEEDIRNNPHCAGTGTGGGPSNTCSGGTACDSENPCSAGYCQQGCCVNVIIK